MHYDIQHLTHGRRGEGCTFLAAPERCRPRLRCRLWPSCCNGFDCRLAAKTRREVFGKCCPGGGIKRDCASLIALAGPDSDAAAALTKLHVCQCKLTTLVQTHSGLQEHLHDCVVP